MPAHYKAFLVVMIVTAIAFWLARPAFTNFMADDAFKRRRNLWLTITACAFLIPNFWLYMAVAAGLIWRAAKREPNPAALYLFLLLVVPPFQQAIPGFGLINQLFPLDHFRLLGLFLIVPAALSLRRAAKESSNPRVQSTWLAPDVLLIIYGALPIILYAPYVSLTGTMRGTLLLGVDVLLPYYVLSRSCRTKAMVVEAVAAFALAAVVLAPLALFESIKGWLLYSSLASYWQIDEGIYSYLLRGDVLRAQVTSGQSIVLGNFYAVVLGLWLYLQSGLTGFRRWLGTAAVVGGVLAAFSRGPWVGAVVCCFAFFAVGPNAKTRVFKFLGAAVLAAVVALASPFGDRILDNLPFIGTVDAGNVTDRQAINDRSIQIISQNPFFGSPYFGKSMEDLRTGEGIIDLLNVYLSIGMAYGLVTLTAFVLFLTTASIKCLRMTRMTALSDPDTSRLGAALSAAMAGTLVIIYTVSNYLSVPYLYVSLAALMVAYSRIPSAAVDRANQITSTFEGVDPRRRFGLRA